MRSKKFSKSSANKSSAQQSGEIRIIGGQWRGRKLKVHDKEGLRPTTDRLKETLFNWLMTDIREAKVLDCFAGAGSLGFEAASRFANSVTAIELDKMAAKQLKVNTQQLNTSAVQVLQGDCLQQLTQLSQTFDVVFIDPPFFNNLVSPCLTTLTQNKLLADDAVVYVEQEINAPLPNIEQMPNYQLQLIKEKKAGQVNALLYRVTLT